METIQHILEIMSKTLVVAIPIAIIVMVSIAIFSSRIDEDTRVNLTDMAGNLLIILVAVALAYFIIS